MNVEVPGTRTALVLFAVVIIAGCFAAFTGAPFSNAHVSGPELLGERSVIKEGTWIQLPITEGIDPVPAQIRQPFEKENSRSFVAAPDEKYASRTLAIPLAMQWRHPKLGLPAGQVVRVQSDVDDDGFGARTLLFHDHGDLPVVALVMDHDDLFDPDRGIMVVGNAMLHANVPLSASYERDPVWWKYPGNFMGRGKEWERNAQVEFIDANGILKNVTPAKVRIHGQMTRGFPQHALRLTFKKPSDPWAKGGNGYRSLVLRAAGNDQVKAMMRDVVAHGACEGLGFDVSAAITCVLYINGVYWGIHHLRERIDEHELQRRYGIDKDDLVILEDDGKLYHGDTEEQLAFQRVVEAVENAPSSTDADAILQQIDVDGFVHYMASQIFLGNMDWPQQNVRYWRYTGEIGQGHRDGRWRFIMGDTDLAMGANAPATMDPFIRVQRSNAIIARLFKAIMKQEEYRMRFHDTMAQLLKGKLSEQRLLAVIEQMSLAMNDEMVLHTARWRKPRDHGSWAKEVEVVRQYIRKRHGYFEEWLMKDREHVQVH
jgi:hypothetical protein